MTAALVQNGARVYIASRKLHDLESVAASMNETARGGPWPAGTACIPLQADLSSKAGCDALAAELARLRPLLAPAGMVWVSWPKKAAKLPTDVTEDLIRELALPLGYVDIKVCAVDTVWSGLKLVIRKSER